MSGGCKNSASRLSFHDLIFKDIEHVWISWSPTRLGSAPHPRGNAQEMLSLLSTYVDPYGRHSCPDGFPRHRLTASFFSFFGSVTDRSVTARLDAPSCSRFISWGLKVFLCIQPSAIDGETLSNMRLPSVCVLHPAIRRVLTQGV